MKGARRRRPEAGAVIDGFRLLEMIHEGTMASIWRASVPGSTQPLILKIPLLRTFDDPAAIVGFEVEQMILPRLTGPHVPRFVSAGDLSVEPYIAMELIPGDTLRARIVDAPLPPQELASIGARVATALHEVHTQGVLHLDLKPSNVMFRGSGEAVLIDFGLSRHDRLPDLLAEEFRLPLGTAPYISPEQVRHVRSDPRSDLFALGVLLYILATGDRPFGNPTTVRGLRQRLYRDPLPPRARVPGLPPWLQEIILHCLEVEAGDRPETAAQVAFELQHSSQVVLTARSERLARDRYWKVVRRRFGALGAERAAPVSAAQHLAQAPIIVLAVDLLQGSEALAGALRLAARRVLQAEPGARLACVTVLKTSRIGMDVNSDEEGRNLHVRRLVDLKEWARTLDLPSGKVTYHVLEAPDPAAAILAFARLNRVDQIVIGSRGSSTFRRYLGSVSSHVVAQAPCTVTVVKAEAGPASTGERADTAEDLYFD